MSANDIPEWAKVRACELVRAENPDANVEADDYLPAFGRALARYIAGHEEAPVDAVQAAATLIYDRWLDNEIIGAEDAIKEGIQRGIELAKAGAV